MKIVIAPDSYKGSLSATQAASIMARAVQRELPTASVHMVPMADGGEGTVDSLVAATKGRTLRHIVTGPLGDKTESYYGETGDTAILEAANVCGLTMVPQDRRNPLHTTSRGLGEAMMALLDKGFSRFIIGLGGSATNDGGMGMLAALGAVFTDADGQLLEGYGRDLGRVVRADFSGLDARLKQAQIRVACDVTNPLLGPKGASFVYGPQKGATPAMVAELDVSMTGYASVVEAGLGHFRDRPGAGAAGGLGFALLALGAELIPGAQVVEQLTGLSSLMRGADWVFTGEGRSDGQTLFGKLPIHVAHSAKEAGTKAVLISGSLGHGSDELFEHFAGCFSIVDGPATLQECMDGAEQKLFDCTRNVMRLIVHAGGR